MITVQNNLGTISITKQVIGRIVAEAIDRFDGKVMISNHKGKVAGVTSKKNGPDERAYMDITHGKNGIDLRVFIVIRFGTSITKVTNQLVDDIHGGLTQITGKEPNSVAVVVTGMISKNIARRHIEVTR